MPEQSWSDEPTDAGLLVVVTDNPVARAVVAIATTAGRRTVLLADRDVEQSPLEWLADHPLETRDALVLCDHDTPEAEALLRAGLTGAAGYVAMLGSRRRAESVFAALERDLDEATLARLHVPAGLDTGGRHPGEMALSLVAEVVAVAHGRTGGPMKGAPARGTT